jgi:hypothetical protein
LVQAQLGETFDFVIFMGVLYHRVTAGQMNFVFAGHTVRQRVESPHASERSQTGPGNLTDSLTHPTNHQPWFTTCVSEPARGANKAH